MNAIYEEARQQVLTALQELGQVLAIRRIGKTFDPVIGDATESISLDGSLNCLVLPVRGNSTSKLDNYLLEALTQGRLRKVLAAASGAAFAPEPNDVLIFKNANWRVLGSAELAPDGNDLFYTMLVEKTNLSAADAAALPLLQIEDAINSFLSAL